MFVGDRRGTKLTDYGVGRIAHAFEHNSRKASTISMFASRPTSIPTGAHRSAPRSSSTAGLGLLSSWTIEQHRYARICTASIADRRVGRRSVIRRGGFVGYLPAFTRHPAKD